MQALCRCKIHRAPPVIVFIRIKSYIAENIAWLGPAVHPASPSFTRVHSSGTRTTLPLISYIT